MAVQLIGYQGPEGFKRQQAYDPTNQLQDAARQQKQYNDQAASDYGNRLQQLGADLEKRSQADLEAYSQWSTTLSTFLVEQQKKTNDKQYKLGLAEVMNGNVDFPDDVYNNHEEDKAKLQAGVEAEGKLANQLEADGQPVEAARVRREGRATKGWRAYGQAVGTAKLAALKSQQDLLSFWTGTDKIIPTPDGMKSPSQIAASGTDDEIAAGNAVLLNRITEKYELDRINPVIIADEFSPTWQANSSNISAGLIQQIDKNRKEDANRNTTNQIKLDVYKASQLDETQSTALLSQTYQQATQNYENLGGMTKGKAADMAFASTLAAIQQLPKEQALAALDALEGVAKIAKDPSTGTLGQLYREEIKQARNSVLTQDLEERQLVRREKDEKANALIAELEDARDRHTGDPAKLAELTNSIYPRLQELGEGGLGSSVAREWLANDKVNSLMPKEYVTRNTLLAKAQSGLLSQEEIDAADLPEDEKKRLARYSDEARKNDFLKENGTMIKSTAKSAVMSVTKAREIYTFGDGDNPNSDVTAFLIFNQRIEDELWDYVSKKRAKGEVVSEEEIIIKAGQIAKARHGEYYDSESGAAYRIGDRDEFRFGTTPEGRSVFDIRHVSDKNINASTADGRFSNYQNTIVLSKDYALDEARRYQQGAEMGTRAGAYLANRPGERLNFIVSQLKHHGLPTDKLINSEPAQRERSLANTAPQSNFNRNAAQDSLTRVRADRELRIIGAERERWQSQERGEQPVAPKGLTSDGDGGTFQKDAPLPDDEIFRLAVSVGLSPEEAVTMTAIALAESAGIANNRNFTLRTGDRSYGLWQINMLDDERTSYYLGRERRRALGLTDNDQLYDPMTNARAMYYVLKERKNGYSAWSVYKNGSYTQFLPAARRALQRWQDSQ